MAELTSLSNREGGHRARITTLIAGITQTEDAETLQSIRTELLRQKALVLDMDTRVQSLMSGDDLINDIGHSSEIVMNIERA